LNIFDLHQTEIFATLSYISATKANGFAAHNQQLYGLRMYELNYISLYIMWQ